MEKNGDIKQEKSGKNLSRNTMHSLFQNAQYISTFYTAGVVHLTKAEIEVIPQTGTTWHSTGSTGEAI